MDSACFAGTDKARVNVMSATFIEDFDYETVRNNMRKVLERIPKARYQIVQVLGDYYYKDTPIDEAIEYVFKRLPKDK
jgi:hypothetical protein